MIQDAKSVFSSIAATIGALRTGSTTSVKVDDLLLYLSDGVSNHEAIVIAINSIGKTEREDWIKGRVTAGASRNNTLAQIYLKYKALLSAKAATAENKLPLESLVTANATMAETLRRISRLIKQDYEGKTEIKLNEFRISTTSALGLLNASDTLMRFSFFLVAGLINATLAAKMDVISPKYREAFLVNNCGNVVELVNSAYSTAGILQVVDEINKIRSNGYDIPLTNFSIGGIDGIGATIIGFLFTISTTFIKILAFAVPLLRGWFNENLGLKLDQATMKKHQERKEMREWLTRHVSLLRLELNDTNPDDPRYQQLVKIIAAYDEKITEYDRTINEFEESIRNA